MTCEEAVSRIALRPEDLEAAEREALEGHLAACPACRSYRAGVMTASFRLREGGRALEAPFPAERRAALPARRWRPAAAAALLLAGSAGVLVLLREDPPAVLPPSQSAPEAQPPSVPSSGPFLAGRDMAWPAGPSALLSLRKGGRIRQEPGRVALEAGSLHVESEGGGPLLAAGSTILSVDRSEVTLEALAPEPALAWIASAQADAGGEPEFRLVVWRGAVVLDPEGARETLGEGQAGRLEAGRFRPEPGLARGAWRGPAWTPAAEGELSWQGGVKDLLADPPAAGYVLEALVRKASPMAELGVRIAAGGALHEVAVGSCLPAGETWTRLRVEVAGGWCRAWVGGQALVDCPVDALQRSGQRVPGRSAGLRAWGGALEARQLRWRPWGGAS